jgi:hypothetical protein
MAGPSRNGLRLGLAVLGTICLLLVAGRLLSPGLTPPVASLQGDIFPPTRPIRGGLEFGQEISGLAVTWGAVWVAHGATIERLDPRTLRTTGSVRVPGILTAGKDGTDSVQPTIRGLAAEPGGDVLWASLSTGLLRIDAAAARIATQIPMAIVAPPAVGEDGVWVVCCGGETYLGAGQLIRVDPATNRVVARTVLPGLADAVGVGASGVWVRAAAGPVWRVDPATNRVAATVLVPHGLGGTPGSVLVGRGAVWVSDPASATVLRIDPRSNRIAGLIDAAGPALAAAKDGTVVATSSEGLLSFGPESVRSIHLDGINGQYTTALAAMAGTIWVAESAILLHVDRLDWS